jgi:Cu/Ag efflux protein CusF
MIRAHKTFYLGLALATWTTAGVAIADEKGAATQAPEQKTMAQKMSATARVEKVDLKKRELTLKDDQGNTFMMDVPEDVTGLDKVKKGDKIDVDYYESVTLALKKPQAGETPQANEQIVAERSAGGLPGGAMGRKITATVTVAKVDPSANKVTIKAPDGTMDTINVSDPSLQSELPKIKKGDRIKASYTEAMAISVAPKNKE